MKFLFVLLVGLMLFNSDDSTELRYMLKSQLMVGHCSESPCLFGESLSDTTPSNLETILDKSNLSESITNLERSDWGIRWIWSDEFASQLGIQNRDYRDNFIGFSKGKIHSVRLSFITELQFLIEIYGEPITAIPFTYNRWGDMYWLLQFENIEGYFKSITRCDEPQLIANTKILGHMSTSLPYGIKDYIRWEGYTRDLPTCVIFQP